MKLKKPNMPTEGKSKSPIKLPSYMPLRRNIHKNRAITKQLIHPTNMWTKTDAGLPDAITNYFFVPIAPLNQQSIL
jgi:hypothetical protein